MSSNLSLVSSCLDSVFSSLDSPIILVQYLQNFYFLISISLTSQFPVSSISVESFSFLTFPLFLFLFFSCLVGRIIHSPRQKFEHHTRWSNVGLTHPTNIFAQFRPAVKAGPRFRLRIPFIIPLTHYDDWMTLLLAMVTLSTWCQRAGSSMRRLFWCFIAEEFRGRGRDRCFRLWEGRGLLWD